MVASCPMTWNPVYELMSNLGFSSEPQNHVSNPLLSISTWMLNRHLKLHVSNNWTPGLHSLSPPQIASFSIFPTSVNCICIHSPVSHLKFSNVYLFLPQQILSVILQIYPKSNSSPQPSLLAPSSLLWITAVMLLLLVSNSVPPPHPPQISLSTRSQVILLKHEPS